MQLTLNLFGPPDIHLDGEPLAGLNSNKVRALLFYLAVESGRSHRRESLAGLLWPDYPERSARTNLSNALSNLRTALDDRDTTRPYLFVSRETIQFNVHSDHWVDATMFEEQVARGEWQASVDLYRGPFLEGFSIADSPPFEQWALMQRERLQRQMMAALEGLAACYEKEGDFTQAIAVARHQLELEPWHEEGHQMLMRLLALDGQRSAALAQYEACTRVLKQELDVAPGVETQQLYQDIRDGKVVPGKVSPGRQAVVPVPDAGALLPSSQAAAPAPISPVGERRLATVLHVEVAESAALLDDLGSEAWVEQMEKILRVLTSEVDRYGGQVIEQRRDGLTALFGLPVTHEDDAERALLAALAVQARSEPYRGEQTCSEVHLRVGVDSGELLVTYTGGEQQVVGRVPALARRASVAADPGAVLVGENAYRLVRSLFEWDLLEGQATRGLYRPLARKALGDKGRGIEGLSSSLIGRDEELSALRQAIDDLQRGIGGIVTLVGEAGIGKSRLVAELRKRVTGDQVQWVEGRCLSYGGSTAYLLWLDMLRSVLHVAQDAPPAVVGDALRTRVQRLCPNCFDAVYPFLCRLMSLPLGDEYEAIRDLRGESLRAEVFSAVQALVEAAARQQLLVMVCEDLHWADPTSLALLEQVLALTDRAALLLVCILRPEVEHGCWQIKETAARQYRHRHTDLWLDALSADESQSLVGHLLSLGLASRQLLRRERSVGRDATQQIEALPVTLRARILDHAEGNPFYVEEILRALIDDGAIVYDDTTGQWQPTREIADIPIPGTLHGVLSARIDRLQVETRHVLRLASVIGRVFLYRILAEIACEESSLPLGDREASRQRRGGSGVRVLETHLLTLQRQQLIRERARVPELEYIFKHELTREAAYNGLLKKERLLYHRQVAEALERLFPDRVDEQAGLLAHHWERAEEPQKAILYLLQAGELARAAYANEVAIDYYRRALNVLEDVSPGTGQKRQRLTALSGLGIVRFGMGGVVEAEPLLRKAIALGKEIGIPARELTRLYYWLGETLWWQDCRAELIQIGEEGLALLGDDVESVEAVLMDCLIEAGYAETDWNKHTEMAYQTAQFIRRLPYVEELRPAYDRIFEAYRSDNNLDEALRWAHILEQKARAHHDLRGQANAFQNMALVWLRRGDLDKRLALEQQVLALYTRIGDTKHSAWAFQGIAQMHYRLGRPQQAQTYFRRALEILESVGIKSYIIQHYIKLGRVALCQHCWEEAAGFFQKALSPCQGTDRYVGHQREAIYLLGRANQAMGKYVEAAHLYQKSIELHLMDKDLSVRELSGLEEVLEDAEAFRTLCHRFQKDYSHLLDPSFVQWVLEPAAVATSLDGCPLEQARGLCFQSPGWTWTDPFGDCFYATQNGLDIHAANGRFFGRHSWGAPRWHRQASGNMVVQTVCVPGMDDRPAIGGLLLWKDEQHFLCLERGPCGRRDIQFSGCVDDRGIDIGRGWLPSRADGSWRMYLRLERSGDLVRGFCSADGEQWFTVGYVTFPVQDPIQVGVYAVGEIDRGVYHGAYPEGTAIRFESFRLWQENGQTSQAASASLTQRHKDCKGV